MAKYFSFFLAVLLYMNHVKSQDSLFVKYGISEKISKAWKNDKHGCLGSRALYLDSVKNNMAIIGLLKKDILKLFGLPDEKSRFTLIYYSATYCKVPRKIDRSVDYCQFVFMFSEKEILEFMNIECT